MWIDKKKKKCIDDSEVNLNGLVAITIPPLLQWKLLPVATPQWGMLHTLIAV